MELDSDDMTCDATNLETCIVMLFAMTSNFTWTLSCIACWLPVVWLRVFVCCPMLFIRWCRLCSMYSLVAELSVFNNQVVNTRCKQLWILYCDVTALCRTRRTQHIHGYEYSWPWHSWWALKLVEVICWCLCVHGDLQLSPIIWCNECSSAFTNMCSFERTQAITFAGRRILVSQIEIVSHQRERKAILRHW